MILKNTFHSKKLYVIDAIALRWRKMGYEVITHYGTKNLPDADIVILHVDATIISEEYVECLSQYPVVLNRNVINISKSMISRNIVKKDENYPGPVIIKTNANFGGKPEAKGKRISHKKKRWLGWLVKKKQDWENVDVLNPNNYPIFENKEIIPAGVWNNKNLIVEKFLPEKEDGLFFLRYWIFLGDQGWAGRFGAQDPIVKFSKRVTNDEPVPVPDELKIVRKKFCFDYGRFDYAEYNGKTVLFDTNKTLGLGRDAHSLEPYSAQLDMLASGIRGF